MAGFDTTPETHYPPRRLGPFRFDLEPGESFASKYPGAYAQLKQRLETPIEPGKAVGGEIDIWSQAKDA